MKRHLTYANVMATLAVVFALGGGGQAIAAIIISGNDQVATNTIAGHHPPAGKHANLIGASVNATDLAPSYKTSLDTAYKLHCTPGFNFALGSGLCYDQTPRASTTWEQAVQNCAGSQMRLPTTAELVAVYTHEAANQDEQWTQDRFFDTGADFAYSVLAINRQVYFGKDGTATKLAYRCVVTPMN